MHFFVYILYSQTLDRYYIGYTQDPAERLLEHNSGATNFTRRGKPWVLVYVEEFNSKSEAISREKQIKKMKSRKYIEGLIKSSGGQSVPTIGREGRRFPDIIGTGNPGSRYKRSPCRKCRASLFPDDSGELI